MLGRLAVAAGFRIQRVHIDRDGMFVSSDHAYSGLYADWLAIGCSDSNVLDEVHLACEFHPDLASSIASNNGNLNSGGTSLSPQDLNRKTTCNSTKRPSVQYLEVRYALYP